MASPFRPPRASYSPGFGSSFAGQPENHPHGHQQSSSQLSLVVINNANNIHNKDASPGSASFPSNHHRPPLDPIGTNNNGVVVGGAPAGFGLRQRRQDPHGSNSSGMMMAKERMNGPPRASLSLAMATSTPRNRMIATPTGSAASSRDSPFAAFNNNSFATADSLDNNWVLVYGMSTKDQLDEILATFKKSGDGVINVKGGPVNSSRNWVAVQYESTLKARLAADCDLQLSDGCMCRVNLLPNSRMFFQEQQGKYANMSASSLVPTTTKAKEETDAKMKEAAAVEIKEADVFATNVKETNRKRKSPCETFMAWTYGW